MYILYCVQKPIRVCTYCPTENYRNKAQSQAVLVFVNQGKMINRNSLGTVRKMIRL